MADQGFPIVQYEVGRSPQQWGQAHGESFRGGIRELVEIRRALMYEKNTTLTPQVIGRLAHEQWEVTQAFDSALAEEIRGICAGAAISIEDIVILNNYTDFRDIQVQEQGCSVVVISYAGHPVAGQTWDMHRSAKDYVCCLRLPGRDHGSCALLFSVVGCLGMMGFQSTGTMVGVNNINTDGARPGVLWPCVVRRALRENTVQNISAVLAGAPVTSGHAYLAADRERAEFWEVMPGLAERVSQLRLGQDGFLFHTNHCLGDSAKRRETPSSLSSTTFVRYDLLQKKAGTARTFDDVVLLLNDHENYPKSICSNFQTSSQDPSVTCGGAVGDLVTGKVVMWRGDQLYDKNFVRHQFELGTRDVA